MWSWLRYLWIRSRLGKQGQTISVKGLKVYYESYGDGEPLLLLHGGLSSLEGFRFQIPELSRHYRVILPERRGHGRTRDTSALFSYQDMADETAGFMQALGLKQCKMLGYSDGANVIYYLALQRPELIERFISVGGNFHYKGCLDTFRAELEAIPEGQLGPEGIDPRYARVSPDGASHFVKVFHKTRKLWLSEPTFTEDQLAQISTPALIMAGEHDCIALEHSQALARALPRAKLAILAGASHSLLKEVPRQANKLILQFLAESI